MAVPTPVCKLSHFPITLRSTAAPAGARCLTSNLQANDLQLDMDAEAKAQVRKISLDNCSNLLILQLRPVNLQFVLALPRTKGRAWHRYLVDSGCKGGKGKRYRYSRTTITSIGIFRPPSGGFCLSGFQHTTRQSGTGYPLRT